MSENGNDTMSYRGHTARIVYSAEDNCLVGRLLSVPDNHLVSFHGDSVTEIRQAMRDAVDHYLDVR